MSKVKSEAAQAAALIRKQLKSVGLIASVRSENYSCGNSVTITLKNASSELVSQVKRLADFYKDGDFDGMTDSYEYRKTTDNLPRAKFVFVQNEKAA